MDVSQPRKCFGCDKRNHYVTLVRLSHGQIDFCLSCAEKIIAQVATKKEILDRDL